MKKMDNSIKITGMIIGAVIFLALIGLFALDSFEDKETVQVQGSSVVTVTPDIVSINFAVETRGDTSKEAKDANSPIVSEVVDSLMDLGFEREDIETMNLNIYEEFDWSKDKRESIGFKATHEIRVRFAAEEQPELGPIVDAGVDAGALLRYINFELSRDLENEYKAEALRLAGSDAKMKAEAMATGVGAKLGDIVSVSDSSFGYQPWLAYDSRELAGASVDNFNEDTSIQIGEREIQGRISVVYELN